MNPTSTWGAGYWINHLQVPWLNVGEILARQAAYDPTLFRNECLGLPTALGEHGITMRPGLHSDIVRIERFRPDEEPDHVLNHVAESCRLFRVKSIAADGGGNGYVYNRLLHKKLEYQPNLYGIIYSTVDQDPVRDGTLWRWTVDRSRSIAAVFTRIKAQFIHFPRVAECGSFLNEFACEVAEYDSQSRTIRYIHPEGLPDDALHATTYLQLIGLRMAHASHQRWTIF
jgi:hypothetical protein